MPINHDLQDFIDDFPESAYLDEAYSYLVNALHKDYPGLSNLEANG